MPTDDYRSEILVVDNWGDQIFICPVIEEEKDGDQVTVEIRIQMKEENTDNTPCLWLTEQQFLEFAEKIKCRAEEIMFSRLQTLGGVTD